MLEDCSPTTSFSQFWSSTEPQVVGSIDVPAPDLWLVCCKERPSWVDGRLFQSLLYFFFFPSSWQSSHRLLASWWCEELLSSTCQCFMWSSFSRSLLCKGWPTLSRSSLGDFIKLLGIMDEFSWSSDPILITHCFKNVFIPIEKSYINLHTDRFMW